MGIHIDENILSLVGELNQFKTVQTFSSCGGHENPDTDSAQLPLGEFNVNFYLDFNRDGEDDLERIGFAVAKFLGEEEEPGEWGDYVGTATLKAWWNGDFEELKGVMCFELWGNCDPKVLAQELVKTHALRRD